MRPVPGPALSHGSLEAIPADEAVFLDLRMVERGPDGKTDGAVISIDALRVS